MREKQRSPQEVLVMASELRRMLKTDAFEYAVSLLRKDYETRFFSSKPHEAFAREQAYHRNAALDDVISAMETIIYVAENSPED